MEPEYNNPASSLSDYDDPIFEEIVKNNTFEIDSFEGSYSVNNTFEIDSFEGSHSVNNSNDVATIPTAPAPEEICTSSYATMLNEWMQQGSFINTSIHWLLITSISTDPITALHSMHAICAHYNIKVRFSRDTNYVAHRRFNDEGDVETFPCHLDIMLSIYIYITVMRLSSDTNSNRNRDDAVDHVDHYDNDVLFPEAFVTESSMDAADATGHGTQEAAGEEEAENQSNPDDPDGPFQKSSKQLLSGILHIHI